jgi:hypothetical protein
MEQGDVVKRKAVLSSIVVLLLVIFLFQLHLRRSRVSAIEGNTLAPGDYTVINKDGSELHRDRINQLLATLKGESLQQSVANLTNDSQQYSYPGFKSSRKGEQDDVEVLLSARRVTKVLQTIARLGKEDAASQSRALFEQSFGRHQEIIDKVLASYETPGAPKNTESMLAATYAMSACMLGTALRGDTHELSRQLEQIDTFLKRTQERINKGNTLFPNNFWQLTRHFMEPDKRSVLNILIYSIISNEQMSGERSKVETVLKDFPRKEVPIVAWDAKTGYYDYVHVIEGIPIDRDKIDTTLVIYDWPDNMRADTDRQSEIVELICSKIRPSKGKGP